MSGDKKWINLSFVSLAIILAWILNQTFLLVARYAKLQNPLFLDVLPTSALLAMLVSAAGVFLYTRQAKVQSFAFEVLQELKKVVWPTRKVAYLSTIVVVILVVISASVLGVFDWLCTSLIGLVLKV
ncbi:MAG TPA: preprotein translocase subunit SecE [Oligoflexia bacterium]|nr:preprotein translocase subunit SecE [Oligoflexia bacterium]HMR25783.1 preprotein translocase subunit SecE [Oligoflexia bacterium]